MKKWISVMLAAVMLLGTLAMSAAAADEHYRWDNWGTQAEFYLLNEGLTMPVGTAPEPTKNYTFVGHGSIKSSVTQLPNGYFNAEGVDQYLQNAPKLELKDGQTVIWYVIKRESEGWHVDGVITPFCSVLYEPNGDDVTGATTDGAHYYKGESATIQENAFSRKQYDFVGWNTAADGSGKTYQPGDLFAFNEAFFSDPKSMSTVTLYAMWKKQPAADETQPGKNTVKGSIVCPKKMSVRFEDGTVYYGGESIDLEIGKEYKFQMCSNDWDTDTYTDDGHGICGTVVYTVRVSDRYDERSYDAATKTFVLPKGDPVLRTDVNRCFMAYRNHFKTDYNKQTGIKQVVNTPLESLSVNLPLGSTIRSDAYIAYKLVGSADLFIENNEDLTISYTDYRWNY